MVNSGCNFFSQIAYPSIAELGLRVNQLGNTSATFEVGIFEKGSEEVRAVGGFTHVFCDMKTMKPQKQGMCDEVRKGLEAILVAEKPRL
jgi:acyl-CoA thioester hydrolase